MVEASDLNQTRLADADALIWAVERDPRLASTVSSIALFDAVVDPAALRIRLDRTTRIVGRMRQRVVGNPLSLTPPRWEIDPQFDLDRHLEIADASGDRSLRATLDDIAPNLSAAFDRSHPLWWFRLVQGIEHEGRTCSALIMKAHHSIADGMGMLQIQAELFDFEPGATDPTDLPPEPVPAPLGAGARLTNALNYERERTRTALGGLRSAIRGSSATPSQMVEQSIDALASGARVSAPAAPLSPVLVERSAEAWHDVISLDIGELKAAAKRAGTRLNAVFVAGSARGLGLFHEQVGADCSRLRMGMPISLRTQDGLTPSSESGNQIVPIRVELPLAADEPVQLIAITAALIDSQRSEPANAFVGPSQQLLARLPPALGARVFAHVLRGTDFLTSNLHGSPFPLYIGKAKVLSQHPFGPTSAAAINITLLSYLDEAHIGVSIDAAATDQPELVSDSLRAGFEWILS